MVVDLLPFTYICFLYSTTDSTLIGLDYMRSTVVSYKKRELLTFLTIWVITSLCFVRCVLLIASVFYVVFFVLFLLVLLRVANVASFTGLSFLDCPFWLSLAFIGSKITPSYSRLTLFWRYVQTLDGFHRISPLNLDISISWKQ